MISSADTVISSSSSVPYDVTIATSMAVLPCSGAELVERGRRLDRCVVTQARRPRSDHDPPGGVAVCVDEVGEGRIGLHMPRLPFNRHAAGLARAHEDHGGNRERGVEVKLAPHPYPHESRSCPLRAEEPCPRP